MENGALQAIVIAKIYDCDITIANNEVAQDLLLNLREADLDLKEILSLFQKDAQREKKHFRKGEFFENYE